MFALSSASELVYVQLNNLKWLRRCAGWIPFFEKTDTKECLCESQISCGVTAEVLDALTSGSKCITSATLSHSCEYNIWLWWYLWDGGTKRGGIGCFRSSCFDVVSRLWIWGLYIWGAKRKENEHPLLHGWETEKKVIFFLCLIY